MKNKIMVFLMPFALCISGGEDITLENIGADFLMGNLNNTQISTVRIVEGKLEIVYIKDTGTVITTDPPQILTKVWKDIYIASNNEIVFYKQIEGKYIPPRQFPAKIIFK